MKMIFRMRFLNSYSSRFKPRLKAEMSNQSWEKKLLNAKCREKLQARGGELGVEVAKDDWHWRKYHTTPWLWEMAVFLKHYLWEQLSKKKTTFDGKKHPRTHIESYIDSPICLILIVTASFCNFKNNCGHSCGEMKYTVINALSSSLVSAVF